MLSTFRSVLPLPSWGRSTPVVAAQRARAAGASSEASLFPTDGVSGGLGGNAPRNVEGEIPPTPVPAGIGLPSGVATQLGPDSSGSWRASVPSQESKDSGDQPRLVKVPPQGRTDIETSMLQLLQERRSVGSFFVRKIQSDQLKRLGLHRQPEYLRNLPPESQYRVIMNSLWNRGSYSTHFRRKLYWALQIGSLNVVKSWFDTADGLVMPLLIMWDGKMDSDLYLRTDAITKMALENCANNYADFIRQLKSYKKKVKKAVALDTPLVSPRILATYHKFVVLPYVREREEDGEFSLNHMLQRMALVTQTRATGIADSRMQMQSRAKFIRTVTTPAKKVVLDTDVLSRICSFAVRTNGRSAKSSAGPAGCLQEPRSHTDKVPGGQTEFLRKLCRTGISYRYDPITLEKVITVRRRISSMSDVLSWSIEQFLTCPIHVKTVRLHTVSEPSKARTITIAHYAYTFVMHIFAHMWVRMISDKRSEVGLRGSRQLWSFLYDQMDRSNMEEELPIGSWGLSTDLSEATDYGNLGVARQIWMMLILKSARIPGFPTGLAMLARTFYCGNRYIHDDQGECMHVRVRAWLMGDPMTKLLLTLGVLYAFEASGTSFAASCGDDVIALSERRAQLQKIIEILTFLDFKISEDDTYISRKFLYYCEELAVLPSTGTLRENLQFGVGFLSYIDYPRLRLLISTAPDSFRHSYTDVGRFSLLGKEHKWVTRVSPEASPMMERAIILQHLSVPQAVGTLCPFTPIEIGGDGSYGSPLLLQLALDKILPAHRNEMSFRITQLLGRVITPRYLHVEKTTGVTHRYAAKLPLLDKFKQFVPAQYVIERLSPIDGSMNNKYFLLSSMKRSFMDPLLVIFELAKNLYYKRIFQGKIPVGVMPFLEPPDVALGRTAVRLSFGQIEELYRKWASPGFTFSELSPYLVMAAAITSIEYMSLGWDFEPLKFGMSPGLIREMATSEEMMSISRLSHDEIVSFIMSGGKTLLGERITSRLHMFMESDSYVVHIADKMPRDLDIYLVSRDIKLARRLVSPFRTVHAIDPLIASNGWIEKVVPRLKSGQIITDIGSYHSTIIKCLGHGLLNPEIFESLGPGEEMTYKGRPKGSPELGRFDPEGLTSAGPAKVVRRVLERGRLLVYTLDKEPQPYWLG